MHNSIKTQIAESVSITQSILETLSEAKYVGGGDMSYLYDNVLDVAGAIKNPNIEVLATIPSGDRLHWVNICKMTTATRLNMFGGNSSITPQMIYYWNPATGGVESSSFITGLKAYKF